MNHIHIPTNIPNQTESNRLAVIQSLFNPTTINTVYDLMGDRSEVELTSILPITITIHWPTSG